MNNATLVTPVLLSAVLLFGWSSAVHAEDAVDEEVVEYEWTEEDLKQTEEHEDHADHESHDDHKGHDDHGAHDGHNDHSDHDH